MQLLLYFQKMSMDNLIHYYDNYFNVYQNVILGNKENFEFNKQNQAVFTGENFAEYAQTATNNNSVTVGGITFEISAVLTIIANSSVPVTL